MPIVKFTARSIAAIKLPPAPQQVDYFDKDLRGFGLRVSYGGRKTWFALYRREGDSKLRRKKVGPYPVIGLADARDQVREVLLAATQGKDPAAERKARKKAESVAILCERFITEYAIGEGGEANPNKRSWKKDASWLRQHVIPELGRHKPIDLKRSDIRALVKSIRAKGLKGKPAPIVANRTLEVVRKMFNWAIEEDIVPGLEHNPATSIKKPAEERKRTRDLIPDELAAFWKGLEADEDQESADVLRLMLLLDQRRNEITKLKRTFIDRREYWANIPPEVTKTEFPYRVPISAPAAEIVDRSWERSTDPEYLFPKEGGGGPVSETKVRLCFLRAIKVAGIKDFRPHDILHVATSGMTKMGIDKHVVRKIRHHTDGETTTDRYDHYRYDREKRQAIEDWGERVMEIVTGRKAEPKKADTNVVALRR